jgi:D-arginine dehydrogenase
MEPCDVHPDDLDVARAVERIQDAARIRVLHIIRKWAGLRSFVRDGCPVVGFDADRSGFFWLAGQGGYGIETSPAMGRLCASLVGGRGGTGGPRGSGCHAGSSFTGATRTGIKLDR